MGSEPATDGELRPCPRQGPSTPSTRVAMPRIRLHGLVITGQQTESMPWMKSDHARHIAWGVTMPWLESSSAMDGEVRPCPRQGPSTSSNGVAMPSLLVGCKALKIGVWSKKSLLCS